jgi:hypothetical protein
VLRELALYGFTSAKVQAYPVVSVVPHSRGVTLANVVASER